HFRLLYVTRCLQHMLDLRNGNHREIFRKEEETGKEQSKSSQVKAYLWPSRRIIGPATRQIVSIKGSNDDHKALEPHPDVHDDGHDEGKSNIAAKLLEPEQLGRNHVTSHHRPIAPPVGAHNSPVESVLLINHL